MSDVEPPIAEGREALGARIRERREASGLSVADLAGHAKISNSYLYAIESGRRLPTLEVLAAIASGLKATVVLLLSGIDAWDQPTPTQQ